MEEIHLVFSPDDLAIINRALIVRPYNEVAGVIAKVNAQLSARTLPANPPFKEPYANSTEPAP